MWVGFLFSRPTCYIKWAVMEAAINPRLLFEGLSCGEMPAILSVSGCVPFPFSTFQSKFPKTFDLIKLNRHGAACKPSQNPSDLRMIPLAVACHPARLCGFCLSWPLSGPVWQPQACWVNFFSGWQSGVAMSRLRGVFKSSHWVHKINMCLGCQLSQVETK